MKTSRLFLGALGFLLAAHALVIGLCCFRPGGSSALAARPTAEKAAAPQSR